MYFFIEREGLWLKIPDKARREKPPFAKFTRSLDAEIFNKFLRRVFRAISPAEFRVAALLFILAPRRAAPRRGVGGSMYAWKGQMAVVV